MTDHVFPSKTIIPIGILLSVSGHYNEVCKQMLNGISLSVQQINAIENISIELQIIHYDPQGDLERYHHYAQKLLFEHGVKHIIGCYTSAARKTILPLVESANALLWYCCRYEGFETNNHAIYLGASPNQHIIPLLRWIQREQPLAKVLHIGSNYIWSWEIDRILHDFLQTSNDNQIQTQMLSLGSEQIDPIVDFIQTEQPNILLFSLVGRSAYAVYKKLFEQLPAAQFQHIIKLCLTLSEPEIALLAPEYLEDYISSAAWFYNENHPQDRAFMDQYQLKFGDQLMPSVDTLTAWAAVQFIAKLSEQNPQFEIEHIAKSISKLQVETPMGALSIDPKSQHVFLKSNLAYCHNAKFDVFWSSNDVIKPDPWLINT